MALSELLEEIQKLISEERSCFNELITRLRTLDYSLLICADVSVRKAAMLLVFVILNTLHCKVVGKRRSLTEMEDVKLVSPLHHVDKTVYLAVNSSVGKIEDFNRELDGILPSYRQVFDRSILSYVITSGNRKMLVGLDSRSIMSFVNSKWLDATPDPLETICFVNKSVLVDKIGFSFDFKLQCQPIMKTILNEDLNRIDIAGLLTIGFSKALISFKDDTKLDLRKFNKQASISDITETDKRNNRAIDGMTSKLGTVRHSSQNKFRLSHDVFPKKDSTSIQGSKQDLRLSISPTRSTKISQTVVSVSVKSRVGTTVNYSSESKSIGYRKRSETLQEIVEVEQESVFNQPIKSTNYIPLSKGGIQKKPLNKIILKSRDASIESLKSLKSITQVTEKPTLKAVNSLSTQPGSIDSTTKKGLFMVKKKVPSLFKLR